MSNIATQSDIGKIQEYFVSGVYQQQLNYLNSFMIRRNLSIVQLVLGISRQISAIEQFNYYGSIERR